MIQIGPSDSKKVDRIGFMCPFESCLDSFILIGFPTAFAGRMKTRLMPKIKMAKKTTAMAVNMKINMNMAAMASGMKDTTTLNPIVIRVAKDIAKTTAITATKKTTRV